MPNKRQNNYSSGTRTGFVDLLFQLVMGFVALLLIAITMINPPIVPEAKLDPKAEYLLILFWPDGNKSDIDLWVEDPQGRILSFKNKEVGLMNLDRDDLGIANDFIINGDGTRVDNPTNQEIVSIRGKIEGWWHVNVHFFNRRMSRKDFRASIDYVPSNPIDVNVKLIQVNPYRELLSQDVELTTPKQELTIFNFLLKDWGDDVWKVADTNRYEYKMIFKLLDGEEGGH